jgi:hypothetical protein
MIGWIRAAVPTAMNVNAERMSAYANPVEVVIEGKLTGSLVTYFSLIRLFHAAASNLQCVD